MKVKQKTITGAVLVLLGIGGCFRTDASMYHYIGTGAFIGFGAALLISGLRANSKTSIE